MIRAFIKKRLYSYERLVFPQEAVHSKADISRYMRYKNADMLGFTEGEFYMTPITDLTLPYEEIFMQYDKKLRNQIKRAYKEAITYKVLDTFNLEKDIELLKDIADKYYAFCDSLELPEMKKNLEWNEFLELIKSNNLVISHAKYENGWVYHIYQCDNSSAMLWFSFSDYRQQSGNKQLPGWANRALHDVDIKYFQQHRYKEYDWGNISSVDSPNNIDKFKLSFGGNLIPVYYSFVGNTTKGKILIKIKKALKEIIS